MNCAICTSPIAAGTAAASMVGGLYPVSDPDFFMIDETVMPEKFFHHECVVRVLDKGVVKADPGRAKV
jgi:hypothetical protein